MSGEKRPSPARQSPRSESAPVYPWFDQVPHGLLTRKLLAQQGLRPGGPVRARVEWRKGRRWADLFALAEAQPKRTSSAAQLETLATGRTVQAERRQAARAAEDEEREADEREHEEWLASKIARDRAAAIRDAKRLLALGDGAVIFDTETTDLDGYAVEVAVISLTGGVLFHSLLNPQITISDGARNVHGISDEELLYAPTMPTVLPALEQHLRGRTLTGYGVGFDVDVLFRELGRMHPERAAGMAATAWLREARQACAKYIYSCFVGDYSERHDSYRWYPLPYGEHRALGDCRATLNLLRCIADGSDVVPLAAAPIEKTEVSQHAK